MARNSKTARCQVCKLFPPLSGIGFGDHPQSTPGLPEDLRGAVIWTCAGEDCRRTAKARALAAAATHGITPKVLFERAE